MSQFLRVFLPTFFKLRICNNQLKAIHKNPTRVFQRGWPGRVAQSVGHLTHKSGVLGSIPGLATYFRFSFRFFKKGSYWRKYVHEVLVNRLGGLSLPRKSVVRLTDRPDMTLDVYRGRKTTIQQQEQSNADAGAGFTFYPLSKKISICSGGSSHRILCACVMTNFAARWRRTVKTETLRNNAVKTVTNYRFSQYFEPQII